MSVSSGFSMSDSEFRVLLSVCECELRVLLSTWVLAQASVWVSMSSVFFSVCVWAQALVWGTVSSGIFSACECSSGFSVSDCESRLFLSVCECELRLQCEWLWVQVFPQFVWLWARASSTNYQPQVSLFQLTHLVIKEAEATPSKSFWLILFFYVC